MVKTVFVTGAGGYIGRHAVRALCDAGARVLIPAHHADGADARAQRVEAEIFSGAPDVFRCCGSPDVCLHLAWHDGFRHYSDAHILELPRHYLFLRDMLRGGLPQLAVMGSMHELGPFEGEISENSAGEPDTPYGVAKAALRALCAALCREHGAVFQWLRGYYITGDDRCNHSVFTRLLEAADRGERSFPFTAGRRRFDFIDVEELAAQLSAAVLQREVCGVIECCSGRPISLGERAERFIRENGLDIRLAYGTWPERQPDGAVWGSREKIDRILAAQLDAKEKSHGKTGTAGAVSSVSE